MKVVSGELLKIIILGQNLQLTPFSSVYLWDLDHGFAGVILIKKAGERAPKGCWDSIHVFECQENSRSANYKLTTTVMLWLQTNTAVSTNYKGPTKLIVGVVPSDA